MTARIVFLLAVLASATGCASNGSNGDGSAVTGPTAPGARLDGGEWRVESIGGVPVTAGSNVTLNFLADGKMAGIAACNRYSASYTASGEQLTVSPIISTKMGCAQPLMEQERVYLEALQTVARHEVTGGTLVLVGADGRRITARRSAP